MDNLYLIEERVNTDIDPAGAPGSILAINHNEILKEVLSKTGKYTGSPYIAKKDEAIVPTGIFSWNGNAMDNTNQFTITISKLTSDLNDITAVLDQLTFGSVIRFKDYVGRSVYLDFISFVADVDGSANDIFNIEVKGRATNPSYTYQVAEQQICVLEILINALSAGDLYSVNAFIDGGYKHLSNYDYHFWHLKSYINPELFTDFISQSPVTLAPGHATFDRFDTVVFRNDEQFYVVPGDPVTDPFPPDIDETIEVAVVSILVESNTTSPPGIVNELVLDEGGGEPGEWDGTGTTNVTVADPGDASTGSNSAYFDTADTNDKLTMDNLQNMDGEKLSNVSFDIKFENAISHKIWMRFNLGITDQVSDKVILQNGKYGLDTSNITTWQTMIIPATAWNMKVLQYNQLLIENKKAGASFRIDNIQIQEGTPTIPTSEHVKRSSEIINDGSIQADPKIYVEVDTTGASAGDRPTWNGSEFVMGTPIPPVDEYYTNITALIADQNAQFEDWLYFVTDASDDPEVTSGWAVYIYLGTTLGTIADYQLESKEEDAVGDMDTMGNMTNAKTTPIDADNLTLWDSVASQFKKLTWANVKATLKTYFDTVYLALLNSVGLTALKAELKARVDMGTGTAINWSLGISFIHDTLTGNITFTDSNLPTGTDSKTISLDLDGDFAITVPAYWTHKGGVYDGTVKCRFIIDCVNGTGSSEEVYYQIIPNA